MLSEVGPGRHLVICRVAGINGQNYMLSEVVDASHCTLTTRATVDDDVSRRTIDHHRGMMASAAVAC